MGLTRPRAAQIFDIDYKQAVRVVTTTNVTLTGGAPNQVDGVNLSLKDRVLVTGQSTASQNGIYYVTTLGSGSNGTWSRSLDTNETGEILTGTIVMVTEGTIYADTQWKLITDGTITVGVTEQTWVQNYLANSISSGNSNVVVNANSDVTISAEGTANVLVVSGTGLEVTGNILPSANITYDLGSNTSRWNDIWLSNSSIYLGNVVLSASDTTLNVDGVPVVTSSNGVISTTGNLTAGNILTSGDVSATGNIDGDFLNANIFYATGFSASKIFSGNTEVNVVSAGGNVNVSVGGTSNVAVFSTDGEYVTGLLSTTGNIAGGNILTAGVVSATGNVTGNYIFGNGSQLTGIDATGIQNGTANVRTFLNGNVTISAGGTANVLNVTSTGTITTGTASITGTTTAGNIDTAGTVSATGNITGGNILTAGRISATGNVTGNYIFGNGSQLTGVNAFSTIAVASQSNIVANTISSILTIAAGNNIALTTSNVTNTLTIEYTGTGGSSIFATGGDMGLVTEAVTSSEDLGLIDDAVSISYDLGQLGVDGVVSNSDIIANTITGNKIDSSTFISVTGNLTAANVAITSSATDARGWWYSGNAKSVSAQDSTPNGVWVEPNLGALMYVLGTTNRAIYQYSLSTAYDPASATYSNSSANVSSQDSNPQGMFVASTGTDVYIAGAATGNIYQYQITTPADITTLTYGNRFLNVASQDSAPSAVALKPDGANCYVIGSTTQTVYQYVLSNAGNILSGSYDAKSFSFSTQDSLPVGIAFSSNGVNMYMLGATNKKIYQYVLSDPWNVASGTYLGSYYVGDQQAVPTDIYLNLTQTSGYVTGSSPAAVTQYGLGNGTIATSNSFYHSSSLQLNGNVYASGNISAGNINVSGNIYQNGNAYATMIQAMTYALAF